MPQVKQRNLFEKANRPVFQKLSEQKSPNDPKRTYYILFKTHFGSLEAPILVLGDPFEPSEGHMLVPGDPFGSPFRDQVLPLVLPGLPRSGSRGSQEPSGRSLGSFGNFKNLCFL